MPPTTSLALAIISAAVTPVVMISAAAALVMGLNQKHNALSERLRALMAEFREPETTAARRLSISEQAALFQQRFRYLDRAVRWLYGAVASFVLSTLLITLISHDRQRWDPAAIALFELGIALMLGAVVEALLETRQTRRTLELELRDLKRPELE
jgi:hypothetical protein